MKATAERSRGRLSSPSSRRCSTSVTRSGASRRRATPYLSLSRAKNSRARSRTSPEEAPTSSPASLRASPSASATSSSARRARSPARRRRFSRPVPVGGGQYGKLQDAGRLPQHGLHLRTGQRRPGDLRPDGYAPWGDRVHVQVRELLPPLRRGADRTAQPAVAGRDAQPQLPPEPRASLLLLALPGAGERRQRGQAQGAPQRDRRERRRAVRELQLGAALPRPPDHRRTPQPAISASPKRSAGSITSSTRPATT